MTSFVFITAYFELNKSRNEFYFNEFKKLIDSHFEIILFLDKKLEYKLEEYSKYSNLKVYILEWNDLYLNKTIQDIQNLEIPCNNPKDNINYLILMSSKTYIVKLALSYTDAETLVWIDFGGLKLTDNLNHFKKNFEKLKKYDKILMPGGNFPKKLLYDEMLFRTTYWRFLGTLFICPRHLVIPFDDAQTKEVLTLSSSRKITWEVNYWANVEYHTNLIQFCRANHDNSMYGMNDKKIMLLGIIDDENMIIDEYMDQLRNICDAYCITNFTNTMELEFLDKVNEFNRWNIPSIYHNSTITKKREQVFKNGIAFCNQLGWHLEDTYGLLLEGDKVVVIKSFDKEKLTEDKYNIHNYYEPSSSLNLVKLSCNNTNPVNISYLNKKDIYIKLLDQ
jgi:hypothetical protein